MHVFLREHKSLPHIIWVGMMVQLVKAIAPKPDNLNLILRTHMKMEGEKCLQIVV